MKFLKTFESHNFKLTSISYDQIDAFAAAYGITEDIMQMYKIIESNDTITLYRILGVNDSDTINENDLGIHWTYDKEVFRDIIFLEDIVIDTHAEKYIVITASVPTTSIDKESTLENNEASPDEFEVTLYPNARYEVLDTKSFSSLEEVMEYFDSEEL